MKHTSAIRYTDIHAWFDETDITTIRRSPIQVDQWFQGRYEIFSVLGFGHTSVVFKATDTKLGRVVALKIWHNAGYGIEETVLLKEGRILASLQHPHIVKVYDFGTENSGGRPWTVLEYLGSLTLYDVLKGTGCLAGQWQRVAHIATQVASMVDFLHHSAKIYQLDIKPGNLAIDTELTVIKLMDLGSAYHEATESFGRYGTPGYIAPEVFHGGTVTEKCDLYSLGMLLYEMITGQNPLIQIQLHALDLVDSSGPPVSVAISAESGPISRIVLPFPPSEILLDATDDQQIEWSNQRFSAQTPRDNLRYMVSAAIPIDAPTLSELQNLPTPSTTQKQKRYSQLADAMREMNLRQRLIELATPTILCELVEALTAFDPDSRPPSHEVCMALLPLSENTNQPSLPKVFLSHSKKDKSRFVQKFAAALKRKGFIVWLDEDSLRTGEPFWDSIAQAIEECDFVVVVLSENSITSAGVAEELRAAQLHNLTTTKVLPIRIDPIEFRSIPKALLSRHVLDFVGWEVGDFFQQRCDKLAADIMALRAERD